MNTSRDFGSTMKPVTDYGPAFEYLKYSTGKTITDAPYNYEGTSTPVGNWDNQYMGTITLRQALYLSVMFQQSNYSMKSVQIKWLLS